MNLKFELEQLAAKDQYVRWLGVALENASPDLIELKMKVRQQHLNFHGTCHGGVLFSLADTAFGLASNSDGVIAIGIHADIAYCAPATAGDVLIARAVEVSKSRRVGTYRVDIRHEDGRMVSVFTGTVYRTDKPQAGIVPGE